MPAGSRFGIRGYRSLDAMILDSHIHIRNPWVNTADFSEKLRLAGVSGGILISLPPPEYRPNNDSFSSSERLDTLMAWRETTDNIYPFYWIDPMEHDALEQVQSAADQGVMGFKVICDRFFPGDAGAMELFSEIARVNLPVLFHSGILWDGKPSSRYNRPSEFEALLEVDGLRFCLAHISWPWCDELIAVYGKFLNARTQSQDNKSIEMFVDTTPGTPPLYRKEALARLFTTGYDVENNVMFGTDSCAGNYNVKWAREWIQRDRDIFAELQVREETVNAVLGNNLRRFVGLIKEKPETRPLRSGE